jgi:O-antigen/teichoic acid export membrane protein
VRPSELTRSVGLLGSQRLVSAALGVVRTKIAAALLGPSGVGLLALAISLRDLLRSLSTLGSPNGFLKLVAQERGEGDRRGLELLLSSAFVLYGGLAAVIAFVCVLGAAPIAQAVFDDASRASLVIAVAASLLFLVPVVLIGKVFAGLLDYRTYALLAVGEASAAVVATAVLAGTFGLDGAVWALVFVELAALVASAFLLWRRVLGPLGLRLAVAWPDRAVLRRLLRLASALALTSLAATTAALLVRSEIVRSFGSAANGHYQVAWQVGQNYLGFLGAALWSYGMPRVATELADPEAVIATQNQFLRIALLLFAPGIVVLLVSRAIWIPVLFSDAFLAGGAMLCWQLMGELAAMLRQAMNISLLPRERLGFLVGQGLAYWGLWVIVSYALLGRLGPLAAAVGYLVSNAVLLVATHAYHRAVLGFRVHPSNRRLLATTIPGFVLCGVLTTADDPLVGRLVPLGLVALWAIVHREELRRLAGVGPLSGPRAAPGS